MASSTGKGKAIFRVVSGNFLEMFDFMVFGFYATAIAKTFFPSDSAFASLMLALATFGAGFLMRPLGAIFLGAYIDRHGRRKGLIITLALMAMGTVLIACVPGYATLGVAAPLLVLLGRLLQGFSAGVELGGVSVYLAEIATPGRKGFFVSWQSASQQAAVVFAGLLGVGLNHWLSPEDMGDWGWRIPFLIGCMIVPVIFVIRKSMEETPEFEARKHHPTLREIVTSIGQNFGLVLGGMALVVMTTVSFYLITAYTPTFGKAELDYIQQEKEPEQTTVSFGTILKMRGTWARFCRRVDKSPAVVRARRLASRSSSGPACSSRRRTVSVNQRRH